MGCYCECYLRPAHWLRGVVGVLRMSWAVRLRLAGHGQQHGGGLHALCRLQHPSGGLLRQLMQLLLLLLRCLPWSL
jgi:hypothetical protein